MRLQRAGDCSVGLRAAGVVHSPAARPQQGEEGRGPSEHWGRLSSSPACLQSQPRGSGIGNHPRLRVSVACQGTRLCRCQTQVLAGFDPDHEVLVPLAPCLLLPCPCWVNLLPGSPYADIGRRVPVPRPRSCLQAWHMASAWTVWADCRCRVENQVLPPPGCSPSEGAVLGQPWSVAVPGRVVS